MWCNEHGYSPQFSAPKTSAHISHIERMHHTIMNKMHAMCIQTGLPPNHWDELALIASYLSTRMPTHSLGKTPYEAWFGVEPDFSHLREIGCCAFILIQDRHNPKILAHSYECMLIGYSMNSKAYRLFHHNTGKVIQSYHVKFIKCKDAMGSPLFPGRTVELPVADLPSSPSPSWQAMVKEEEDPDAPLPVVPNSPLHPIIADADSILPGPVPLAPSKPAPCCSGCSQVPS